VALQVFASCPHFNMDVKLRQVYILVMPNTPFFPAWRARLANLEGIRRVNP